MQILRTTQDHGHWHVLLYDETNPAVTGTSEDGESPHRHQLQMLPGQPPVLLPVIDPETGNEHTHLPDAEPVALPEEPAKKPGGTEAERMRVLLELLQIAQQTEQPSREEAKRAREYRRGEQWSPEDRQEMETTGRPALTLNLMAPMLKLLSGYARQNRVDWHWFPVEGSDNMTADLFNIVGKHVAKRTKKEIEEIDAFDEEVEIGRAFLEVIPDFTRNPLGEVCLRHFPSKNVYLTPHLKKDLSDCEALFKVMEMSEADARAKEVVYEDYDDMMECLYEEAQERKWEAAREDGP